jgi:hypothetical protein
LVVLEGARLCETGTENCGFSDASGTAEIQLPIGEESSYTVVKEGYASYLVAYVMGANGSQGGTFQMAHDRLMVARHKSAGAPYPMIGTGTIFSGVAFRGGTFVLDDATGDRFYVDEDGNWNRDLDETTDEGWGGFVDVPPGDDFQIILGGTAQGCTPAWGWPGDVENRIRFPIREGYTTIVSANCPLPPP